MVDPAKLSEFVQWCRLHITGDEKGEARRWDTHEAFVKLAHFCDAGRRVKFASYNPAYPAVELPLSAFCFIYLVKGLMRGL